MLDSKLNINYCHVSAHLTTVCRSDAYLSRVYCIDWNVRLIRSLLGS